MGTATSTRLAVLAAIALAAVSVACGSSTTDASTPAPTATTAPAELQSFSYDLTITLTGGPSPFAFEQRGEVQLPDREHATQTYEVAWMKSETDRITVGERVWFRGDLPWVDLGASPLGIVGQGGTTATKLREMTGVEDELDGQATTRYDLTADEFVALAGAPSGGVSESTGASIWISEALGVPLRMELTANDGGAELSLVLSIDDVNSDRISVEEPPAAQAATTNGAVR
jgi:hypothetical protein